MNGLTFVFICNMICNGLNKRKRIKLETQQDDDVISHKKTTTV